MAKSKSKETSLPVIIALVFFVLTTIGLGVFCYTLIQDQEAKQAAVDNAKKDAVTLRTNAKDNELIARELRIFLGLEEPDDRTVVGSESILESSKAGQALKSLNDLLAKSSGAADAASLPAELAIWTPDFDEKKALRLTAKQGGLMKVLMDARKTRDSIGGQEAKSKEAYDKSADSLSTRGKDYAAAQTEFKTAAAEAPKKFAETVNGYKADTEKNKQDYLKDIDVVRKSEDDLTTQIAQKKKDISKLEDDLRKVQENLRIALEKAKKNVDIFQYDEPQGKIIRRVSDDVVEINLGSAALVRPGLTFTVLPYDFPEKGRQSRIFEDHIVDAQGRFQTIKTFREKGTIEVIQVVGPNLSRARVTQEFNHIRDAMLTGDLLYNSIWRKGVADHIALVGIFDINGDGTDDIEAIVRDLTKMGIPVDAYFDLRTMKWVGKINEQTRYLVVGQFPENTGNDPNRDAKTKIIGAMSGAKKEAADKGVVETNYRDFFPRMGYKINPNVAADKINQASLRYLGGAAAPAVPDPGPKAVDKEK